MGVRLPTVFSNTLTTTVLATATETAFVTTPGLNLSLDNAAVFLLWSMNCAAGTGTTAIQIQIRRGVDITGTPIYAPPGVRITAATNVLMSGVFIDVPGIVAGQQYTLTALQVAGTGAGAFQVGSLLALVL